MKRTIGPLIAAAALLSAPWATAQQQQPAQPPAQPPQQAQPPAPGQPGQGQAAEQITDEELETFADIYIELEETLGRYEQELASAESDQEAQEVQTRMQEESFETISDHGWTPSDYNRVVQAVNSDPNLLQKAVALIEDRRS